MSLSNLKLKNNGYQPANHPPLFKSFFMGGFECSTHQLRDGRRLDLLAASQHDQYVLQDYQRLQQYGIYTIRSGIRWHQIETHPNRYDFSSVLPHLRAARKTGMQVIWDLCHFGWPDELDIFKPEFVRRFAGLASAFAHLLHNETDTTAFISPINEISFFSWAGGDAGYLNPFRQGRSFELKVQLVRAAIEAIEAVWNTLPDARIVHADPVINISPHPDRPGEQDEATGHRLAQYQAWDMLCGRLWPQAGGDEKYLDIIGVNYYQNNQWIHGESPIERQHPLYRPFRELLTETYNRYQRPIFVAETGIENDERPNWFRYIGEEVAAAIRQGVPVEGICWYPILNHPGWDDDRYCCNGLWDYADANGDRSLYEPLAQELRRQQQVFASNSANRHRKDTIIPLTSAGSSEDLICFSHLRWEFVWQRPQHLLSRLAQHYRVLFVEEPISTENETVPRLEILTHPLPNGGRITVVRLIQPVQFNRWIGHGDPVAHPIYTQLLKRYLRDHHYTNPMLWLYTPMASDFVAALPHKLLICDVMDQLSAFKGAPAELAEREAQLLRRADLVFTGGVRLYQAKELFNPNTYLFPSGVEVEHFARAAHQNNFVCPEDMAAIPHPILGYFGVIDERVDLDLLDYLATSHPDWYIVLLGPIAKIDLADLPTTANIHYLGMKTYQQLPAYLAYFDVALVPFALNEATFYLSPTKTLEYMAAHKPIVSTAIQDVITLYGEVVRVGSNPKEFARHIETALRTAHDSQTERENTILAQSTWDNIANTMRQHIVEQLAENQTLSFSSKVPVKQARSIGD